MKYMINVKGMNHSFTCATEESLLTAARRSRAPIAVGCHNGGCGICKIKIVDGPFQIGLMSFQAVSLEEREKGYTLACRTYPLGDITICVKK